jgi:predicted NAD/FAD-binding protein
MRIAIIGTGISGMVSAYLLSREHEVTVFEVNDYVGGHTNTLHVELDGQGFEVDTGFIVYNERTYPNFVRLLNILGVESQPTTMSFSVRCDRTGFEYGTASPRAWFAQRANLIRPRFYRMVRDILRFNREAPRLLSHGVEDVALGTYLRTARYSSEFIDRYIVPMGAAIWSTDPIRILEFPASHFVRFFRNHGLLSLSDQPRWRVIRGGSARYVERLIAPYRDRIRLRCPVQLVRRAPSGVEITAASSPPEIFDGVVVATHSDQALRLLADPTPAEQEVLGTVAYQRNEAVLHTDCSLLPHSRNAWASWNYRIPCEPGPVVLTYNMNLLQGLRSRQPFCVTLNSEGAIDPTCVLRRIAYQHPFFTPRAMAARTRHAEINGVNQTYYAGAYWGFGFHEDGVNSALAVARFFGLGLGGSVVGLDDDQRPSAPEAGGGRLAS